MSGGVKQLETMVGWETSYFLSLWVNISKTVRDTSY